MDYDTYAKDLTNLVNDLLSLILGSNAIWIDRCSARNTDPSDFRANLSSLRAVIKRVQNLVSADGMGNLIGAVGQLSRECNRPASLRLPQKFSDVTPTLSACKAEIAECTRVLQQRAEEVPRPSSPAPAPASAAPLDGPVRQARASLYAMAETLSAFRFAAWEANAPAPEWPRPKRPTTAGRRPVTHASPRGDSPSPAPGETL